LTLDVPSCWEGLHGLQAAQARDALFEVTFLVVQFLSRWWPELHTYRAVWEEYITWGGIQYLMNSGINVYITSWRSCSSETKISLLCVEMKLVFFATAVIVPHVTPWSFRV